MSTKKNKQANKLPTTKYPFISQMLEYVEDIRRRWFFFKTTIELKIIREHLKRNPPGN